MRQFLFGRVIDKYQGGPLDLARPASTEIVLSVHPKMATKAVEYKATAGLFDLMRPFCEKAMANRAERAHGRFMSHHVRFQLLQIHAGSRS
jgi:hypothetical protein